MLCVYDSEEREHGIGAGVNCLGHGLRSVQLRDVFYYESIKRELQIRPIYECRCDERLQTKTNEFTRLVYTG